jgi:predicted nuclease of predicted toxin-antitoxin system
MSRVGAARRILVTMDKDFGQFIFVENAPHSGLVRLPDVSATRRIELMQRLLRAHAQELAEGAILTVRGERVRISRLP